MESNTDDYNSGSITKFNFDETVCRTCMRQNIRLGSLFNILTENICERILFCTGLKIVMENNLPSHICNICIEKLTVAYNFKTKCIQTDKKLHNLQAKLNIAPTNEVYYKENNDLYGDNKITVSDDSCLLMDMNEDVDTSKIDEDVTLAIIAREKRIKRTNFVKESSLSSQNNGTQETQCNGKAHNRRRSLFEELYCEPCDLRFGTKQESDVHTDSVHRNQPWLCKLCGKTSLKKSSYYYHMKGRCKPDSMVLGDGAAEGKRSSKGSKRLGVKRGPYKKRNGAPNALGTEPGCGEHAGKRTRKKFKLNRQFCEKCDVRFASEEDFITHKRDVHKHVYLCEICGRVFYNRDARFSHMTSHERPKFSCDHCDYSTTRKQDLVKHIYVHNGVKRYQCEYCPLSFYTTSNLHNHLRRHRDGPHVCTICQKTILDRYSFKRHMDVHNGCAANVQFPCKLCGSCFRRSSRLNQHLLKRHNVRTPPQRPGRRRIEPREAL